MQPELFASQTRIKARALFVSERISLRALETTNRLAVSPLMLTVGQHNCAALFRYGVVVLFNLDPLEEVTFLSHIKPMTREPFTRPETEEAEIRFDPAHEDSIDNGIILLPGPSIERLQIVAEILARSVFLARYEASIAEVFDLIEPLAARLRQKGRAWRGGRKLARHIGSTLMIHQKMVGRVEIGEKPELLWERPALERLYLRLEDEYELRERHLALERKLDLAFRTAETLLDLMQNYSALRVEWYIVILIVVEILLTLYEMFFKT